MEQVAADLWVTLNTFCPDADIYYAVNDSTVNTSSSLYEDSDTVGRGCNYLFGSLQRAVSRWGK